MPWQGPAVLGAAWQLVGEIPTTNPSSLVLSLVGIFTFLAYQILARPGHVRRFDLPRGQVTAKPQAAEEITTEERRVA